MTSESLSASVASIPLADELDGISPETYANRWKALASIAVALVVISLDNTILNVAIPSIARALDATTSDLAWIIDSYVLVFASLLLTMGSFSDRIGRKRALQIGLVLFGIASIFCALSTTTTQLILARGFAGVGGAIIMPATLSIVSATFPRRERARAFALWASIFGLGVGAGPLLGGLLLRFFPWESVFFVNIPVVIVAVIGIGIFASESRDDEAPPPDIPGVLLSIVGLVSLIYGIISAGEFGWTNPNVLTAFAAAAVFIVLFVIWEIRSPNAMLPMRFFRNPSFTIANLSLVLMTFSLFGVSFFLTQYFQSILGMEPLVAGLAVLPVAVTLVIGGVNSARVAERLGTKRTVALGAFLVGCVMLYYSAIFTPTTPYPFIAVGQIIFALGVSLMVSPSTNSIMQSIPVRKAGVGSAMNDMTRQLGGALGIAILSTILNSVYRATVTPMVDSLSTVLPAEAHEGILRSIQVAHGIAAQLPAEFQSTAQQIIDVTNQGFLDGARQALVIGSFFLFAAAIIAMLFLPSVVRRSEE